MDPKIAIGKLDALLKEERERALDELEPEIEALVEKDVASGLISREQSYNKHRQELECKLKQHDEVETLFEGFQLIKDHCPGVLTGEELEQYETDLNKCTEQLKRIEDGDFVFSEEFSPQEVFKVSDFLMYCFQKLACDLYQKKDLKLAKSVYSVLMALNSFKAEYAVSLAIVCDDLNQEDEAVHFASLGVTLDEADARNHLLLAKLLLKQGSTLLAKESLTQAESLLTSDSPYYGEFEAMKKQV